MTANPMQKKARNAFLLGALIMLIISAILGALGYFLIFENPIKGKEGIQTRQVYIVSQPIKSGEKIIFGTNIKAIDIETSISSGLADGSSLGINSTSKINLEKGTILTTSMINKEEKLTDDVRYVEYNMITLPTEIQIGDYIDIRLILPSGQDFIVISKKQVEKINGDTVTLKLSEGEILIMNSAIVEAYIMTASNLYAVEYVEPGNQKVAINTYRPTNQVLDLINTDPNIVTTAKESLKQFIDTENSQILRTNYIDPLLSVYSTESLDNLEKGIQAQIQKAKEARQNYLTGISTTTSTTNTTTEETTTTE